MTRPFAPESLVSKALDSSKALRPGDCNNVFPLFIALQNVDRYRGYALYDATMLKYLPHIENSIYTLFGMSSNESVEKAC
jgi:hypothetical protein